MRLPPRLLALLLAAIGIAGFTGAIGTAHAQEAWRVPILTWHRFDPSVAKSATVVTTPSFTRQMEIIAQQHAPVITLRQLVEGKDIPPHAVVLTADDGYRSVYTEMFPVLKRFGFHATLFIIPPSLGAPAYLTWAQLAEMKASGLVDIQAHTMTHPNFNTERARRGAGYAEFVAHELGDSRKALETHFGPGVDMLAWPYGIHDAMLEEAARQAGFTAAFALGGRPANSSEPAMAYSRYQVYETDQPERFKLVLQGIPRIPAKKQNPSKP